jgi:hypothetical protein
VSIPRRCERRRSDRAKLCLCSRCGEALFQELLWVHEVIRSNLDTIAGVVAQISDGASATDVRA